MSRPARETDLGELNIRHLNREVAALRAESAENRRVTIEQVLPALSAIADRLGIVERNPPPAPEPPRIPWRLFVTAVAASVTAAGLVLAGLYILGAP